MRLMTEIIEETFKDEGYTVKSSYWAGDGGADSLEVYWGEYYLGVCTITDHTMSGLLYNLQDPSFDVEAFINSFLTKVETVHRGHLHGKVFKHVPDN